MQHLTVKEQEVFAKMELSLVLLPRLSSTSRLWESALKHSLCHQIC